jgi:hypothetical protein
MEYPSKAFLIMTWEDLADGLTLFPLGVAYTEVRARAICDLHGRMKAAQDIETGTDEPAVLTWQEPNIEGHVHLMHEDTGLSLAYYETVPAFLQVVEGFEEADG